MLGAAIYLGGSFCLQNSLADRSKPHHDKDCYLASKSLGDKGKQT